MNWKAVSISLGLVLAVNVCADPTREGILGFADNLFQQGEYSRAITEYSRFLFLYPQDERSDRVRYSTAMAFCWLGDADRAEELLRSLAGPQEKTEARCRYLLALGELYYATSRFQEATGCLAECSFNNGFMTEVEEEKARVLLALSYLRIGDDDMAAQTLISDVDRGKKDAVLQLTRNPVRSKSPAVAAVLSAVMPGAGQFYGGRRRDAAVSLFVNALCLSGVFAALNSDEPVAAAALAGIELTFYTGNIYNAANVVRKENLRSVVNRFRDVEFRVGVFSEWATQGAVRGSYVGIGQKF